MKIAILRMTLELRSPLRIGSGENDPLLDAPVVRDAFGDYRIPGSSLAGAVRAFAEGAGFGDLFGDGGETSRASNLEFSDGFVVDWDGETALAKRLRGAPTRMPQILEVQEQVRIDHDTGTAAVGGKFDAEFVPQGLRFRIEIACVDRSASFSATMDSAAMVGRIFSWFESERIRLGGDVTSGFGLIAPVSGSISHEFHDLATRDGLVSARGMPRAIDAPLTNTTSLSHAHPVPTTISRDSISGIVHLTFLVDGPILVGGSQRPEPAVGNAPSADILFGKTLVADYQKSDFVSRPWVPGSSVKGVIRHRVRHVLEALGKNDAEATVDGWFGSVEGATPTSSRVHVGGQILDDIPPTVVQHVAIDRLTGGSLRGALYAEAPLWKEGLRLAITIELRELPLSGVVALAHAVLDMGTGSLPIGGGVNRGNGRLLFAEEIDPAASWHGRAVRFDIEHNGSRYAHTDSEEYLKTLFASLPDSPIVDEFHRTDGRRA